MKKILMSGVALTLFLNASIVKAKDKIKNEEFENIQFTHVCPDVDLTESYFGTRKLKEETFLKEFEEQTRRHGNPTLAEKGYDMAKTSVGFAARTLWNTTLLSADQVSRWGAAYLTSYYGEEAVVYGISLTARGVTTVATGNPVAGQAIGDGIMGLYKVAQYLPGARGAVAWAVTPVTKIATDLVIDYGPRVAVQTAKTGYNVVAKTASTLSNFSKWIRG